MSPAIPRLGACDARYEACVLTRTGGPSHPVGAISVSYVNTACTYCGKARWKENNAPPSKLTGSDAPAPRDR
jgi:hypothetical protein